MSTNSLHDLIRHSADMSWLREAACAELPLEELDVFFVEAGRTISSATVAMCANCPVRVDCLDHAYQHQIVSGYFGGMSPGKRRSLTHAEARRAIGVPLASDPEAIPDTV